MEKHALQHSERDLEAPARQAFKITTESRCAQVLLLSRDEASMLVVSYADIKRCVETAFAGLKSRGSAVRGPQARLDLRRRLDSQAHHSHGSA